LRLAELIKSPISEDALVKQLRDESKGPSLYSKLSLFTPWNEDLFKPSRENKAWLRYRLEIEENMVFITIAVETNLGNWSRGTLYQVEEIPGDPTLTDPTFGDPYLPYVKELIKNPFDDYYPEKITSFKMGGAADLPVEIYIKFQRRAGNAEIPVDLVVDLGNTRTAAMLLERPAQNQGGANELSKRTTPLRFGPRGTEMKSDGPQQGLPRSLAWVGDNNDSAIVDSWFLLHEPVFAHLEPGQTEQQPDKGVIRDAREVYIAATEQKAWFMLYSMPHAFIELSPALIGGGKSNKGAVRIFARRNLEQDLAFYLSSPKRYVWSTAGCGGSGGAAASFWHQIPNQADATGSHDLVLLRGLIRYFMDTRGNDLNTDTGSENLTITKPNEDDIADFKSRCLLAQAPPTYSRSDATCWFALSLIETAYRQINSKAYLRPNQNNNALRRRLRYIRVTCPSGWTYQERELYFRQWQRAINLFTMAHFNNWEPAAPAPIGDMDAAPCKPVLLTENLDEAVCSQLPVLYSEIKAFSGKADKWIELYGRGRGRVVVMNLDIGGGTTDVAIIEYTNRTEGIIDLHPKLKFRDGYQIAGDMVVKKIIERVLIPAWFEASVAMPRQNSALAQAKEHLHMLFHDPGVVQGMIPGLAAETATKQLARIIRLLFIPLANLLLKGLCGNGGQEPANNLRQGDHRRTFDIKACQDAGIFPPQPIFDLNALCGCVIRHKLPLSGWLPEDNAFMPDAVLKCDLKEVEQCIEEVFDPLFGGLSGLVARHDCDLLIVSGKPSELTRVHELVLKNFPLLPQRIIRVKDYPAGSWYPYAFRDVKEGKITDAKTCTVVGATLYQDLKYNRIPGFMMNLESEDADDLFQIDAYWGVIPSGRPAREFFKEDNLIFKKGEYPPLPIGKPYPDSLEKRSRVMLLNLAVAIRIGRQLVDHSGVQPTPVYQLVWKYSDSSPNVMKTMAEVVFLWRSVKGKGDRLEIHHARLVDGGMEIPKEDLLLQLNTLATDSNNKGEFWLDNPSLNVPKFDVKPPAR
jgi:hypothetical protein